jgi:hypothetical protein
VSTPHLWSNSVAGSGHGIELSALNIVELMGSRIKLCTVAGFVKIRKETGEHIIEVGLPEQVEGRTVLFGGVDALPSILEMKFCA